MSNSKDVEDSLQACREIQNRIDGMHLISDYEESVSDASKNLPHEREEILPDNTEVKEALSDNTEAKEALSHNAESKETLSDNTESKETLSDNTEAASTVDNSEKVEPHPVLKLILSISVCLFTALLLALLITTYVAHHTSVEGSSMEPTIQNGSQLIVEQVSYYLHEPERYDIIVFPNNQGANYIKRIIGLPGETIQIKDGYVYINEKQLEEDNYGNEIIEDAGLAIDKITLKEDEYFILGDNRNGSIDSRRTDIGPVKREQIKGKAWLCFYPFSRFGTIE